MLNRVGGGTEGIKEYLESGHKQGREQSRDEIDTRIVLSGDLDITDEIIKGMDIEGERYLHITLAFKEDEISRTTLEAITEEFRSFTFAAYQPDEYSLYAEAHMPKVKSYINRKTGEFVERKPHIHIVIPKTNLLTGKHLNPFGMVGMVDNYLDAFQEHINNKYGLASPKVNRRVQFTDASEMLSRYKGDIFDGQGHEIKAKLLEAMIASRVESMEKAQQVLAEFGEVKSRRGGYFNIKPHGASKGINLKEFVFSRGFVELPLEEKQALLATKLQLKYEMPGNATRSPEAITQLMDEWRSLKAKEIKYINSGYRKSYEAYRNADTAEKKRILQEKEHLFYSRYRGEETYERPPTQRGIGKQYGFKRSGQDIDPSQSGSGNRKHYPAAARSIAQAQPLNRVRDLSSVSVVRIDQGGEVLLQDHESDLMEHQGTKRTDALRRNSDSARLNATGRTADAVVSQLLRDLREGKRLKEAETQPLMAIVKTRMDASRLLADLARSHGVIARKYEVTKGKDGSDRIKCGTRNLNVSDFLTKELNLPWVEAEQILQASYKRQIEREPYQRQQHTPRKELWANYQAHRKAQAVARNNRKVELQKARASDLAASKRAFYARRIEIQSDRSLKPAERKAALSLARMQRIEREQALKARNKRERDAITAEGRKPYTEQYRDYLAEQAQQGSEVALSELRRMQPEALKKEAEGELYIKPLAFKDEPADPINRRLSYQVHQNGDVTYKRDGVDVLRDQGQRVQMLQTDEQSIETGLRLAMQKFGPNLTLSGSQEFQRQTAFVAAELGLHVKFTDPAINAVMEQRRADLAAERSREADTRSAAKGKAGATPEQIQDSLAEAMRLAKREDKISAVPGKQLYYGNVVARTAHHVVQRVRNDQALVVHELAKLGLTKQQLEALKIDSKLSVDYRKDKPIVRVADPDLEKQKQSERGR
jgi:hypothetical protein